MTASAEALGQQVGVSRASSDPTDHSRETMGGAATTSPSRPRVSRNEFGSEKMTGE